MRVLITGAHGVVGTALLDYLPPDYDIVSLDEKAEPEFGIGDLEYESVTADVTDYESIRPAFEGIDAVVHLAANSNVSAPFDAVLEQNVLGTYNVLRAAADAGVEGLVFASSNHVVGMYEKEFAPELYAGDSELHLDHTDPVRPDSYYATSKVFGEAIGRYYVEREGALRWCHALRIFSVRPPRYDHPYGDAERGVDEGEWSRQSEQYRLAVARMKATWQSRRDVAQLVDCSLGATEDGFDIFYGVSDNENRWVDLSHAREAVGYEPKDRADEWDVPPE